MKTNYACFASVECYLSTETFTAMTVDSLSEGFAAHVSLGVDPTTSAAHIRASLSCPANHFSGKQDLRLEILRDRRTLYETRVYVPFRADVSTKPFSIIFRF